MAFGKLRRAPESLTASALGAAFAKKAPESVASEVHLPDSALLAAFLPLETANLPRHRSCCLSVLGRADSEWSLLIRAARQWSRWLLGEAAA